MAIEEIKYAVVTSANEFEIRDYDSHIVAESIADGDFDEARDRALNRLLWFISGDNLPCAELERPMSLKQKLNHQKIKMTSPIELQDGHGSWAFRSNARAYRENVKLVNSAKLVQIF